MVADGSLMDASSAMLFHIWPGAIDMDLHLGNVYIGIVTFFSYQLYTIASSDARLLMIKIMPSGWFTQYESFSSAYTGQMAIPPPFEGHGILLSPLLLLEVTIRQSKGVR
jgi:hypothetical protein